MAHEEQKVWCSYVKEKHPEHFENKIVLDIGSLDINGNNRYLFEDCYYLGVDIADGKNVDLVSPGHLLTFRNGYFDTIISTECFEHDMYWQETIQNIYRMLKPGGLFLFTCATTGRLEHGTRRSDKGRSSPLTIKVDEWADYYKNLTKEDIESAIDIEVFPVREFSGNYVAPAFDLYFYGIKK